MVKAIVELDEHSNRVINVVKAKYGLKDKSEAIEKIVTGYEQEILEPEFRPEFVEILLGFEFSAALFAHFVYFHDCADVISRCAGRSF